jgi:hypothetical protein
VVVLDSVGFAIIVFNGRMNKMQRLPKASVSKVMNIKYNTDKFTVSMNIRQQVVIFVQYSIKTVLC